MPDLADLLIKFKDSVVLVKENDGVFRAYRKGYVPSTVTIVNPDRIKKISTTLSEDQIRVMFQRLKDGQTVSNNRVPLMYLDAGDEQYQVKSATTANKKYSKRIYGSNQACDPDHEGSCADCVSNSSGLICSGMCSTGKRCKRTGVYMINLRVHCQQHFLQQATARDVFLQFQEDLALSISGFTSGNLSSDTIIKAVPLESSPSANEHRITMNRIISAEVVSTKNLLNQLRDIRDKKMLVDSRLKLTSLNTEDKLILSSVVQVDILSKIRKTLDTFFYLMPVRHIWQLLKTRTIPKGGFPLKKGEQSYFQFLPQATLKDKLHVFKGDYCLITCNELAEKEFSLMIQSERIKVGTTRFIDEFEQILSQCKGKQGRELNKAARNTIEFNKDQHLDFPFSVYIHDENVVIPQDPDLEVSALNLFDSIGVFLKKNTSLLHTVEISHVRTASDHVFIADIDVKRLFDR